MKKGTLNRASRAEAVRKAANGQLPDVSLLDMTENERRLYWRIEDQFRKAGCTGNPAQLVQPAQPKPSLQMQTSSAKQKQTWHRKSDKQFRADLVRFIGNFQAGIPVTDLPHEMKQKYWRIDRLLRFDPTFFATVQKLYFMNEEGFRIYAER